eukprot:Gregarina_sp_Poly_1__8479@NODE_4_length_26097_cov_247_784211_g3_i0_p13_GENE_NODE_4_length_26097_cov_247_784211_g3_i0NODE_4_length_26097_cov_247_784211_g3_i0_p13_ORF_typecomplete_len188_score7_25Ring_hydroxyl_B/PF00866_18/0_021_NODE_4_length_26097_cov_247_784211_g3_i02013920702
MHDADYFIRTPRRFPSAQFISANACPRALLLHGVEKDDLTSLLLPFFSLNADMREHHSRCADDRSCEATMFYEQENGTMVSRAGRLGKSCAGAHWRPERRCRRVPGRLEIPADHEHIFSRSCRTHLFHVAAEWFRHSGAWCTNSALPVSGYAAAKESHAYQGFEHDPRPDVQQASRTTRTCRDGSSK